MAESQKLYPVFEIPAMQASDDTEEQVFLPAPLFDFDTGDFVRDGANRVVMVNGRDASDASRGLPELLRLRNRRGSLSDGADARCSAVCA